MIGKVSKILSTFGTLISIRVDDISCIEEDKINPKFPLFVTVAGQFSGIEEGFVIDVEGEWNYFDKGNSADFWPWQYKAHTFNIVEAENEETIVRFLSSLPGIGDKIAHLIFEKFGTDIYKVIENDMKTGSRSLTIIKGISATKEDVIIASYKEKRLFNKTNNLLRKYNVGQLKVKNIINTYGENTVETITENPYILANDKILSFRTADTFAFDVGISFDANDRIEAAVKNVLDVKASSMGHTFLDYDDAIEFTLKMLQNNSYIKGTIDALLVKSKIADFIKEGKLVEEDGHIYLTYRYNAENFVAKKLSARAKLPSLFQEASPELIEECVESAQKDLKVTLASGQKNAVITAIHNTTTIITGGPGTGKTTTLKVLLLSMDKLCDALGKPVLSKTLAAPTGMAAKRMKEATGMDASTIHRLLDFTPYAGGDVKAKNEDDPIDTDMLIIDESSMLDIDLFSLLMHAVQDKTELIFLGDIDQLPSVGPGDVLHDIIDSEVIAVARLTQTYRQGAQSPILANAKKINTGDTDLIFDMPEEFRFIEIPDSDDDPECCRMLEMTKRVFFEEFQLAGGDINKVQVLLPMRKKTMVSVDNINPELQDTVNSCLSRKNEMSYNATRFRKGDKVVQLTNNYEKWAFNGDVGIVLEVAPKSGKLLVNFGGEENVEYEREELDQLRHSYATTIHKSQGSEYQTVIMTLTMQHSLMLQRNLLYTGLTRAKKKAIIIGDRDALNFGIQNVSNRSRNSELKRKLRQYANLTTD